jgi:type I restriction enzyme S subunit
MALKSGLPYEGFKLGDVAKVISGFAFKSSSFQDHGVPVLKIKNIRVGSVDLADVDYVDPSFFSLDDKYHVKDGDLLISLTGSHLTQPNSVVGRVALYSSKLRHCLLNQRAGKISVTKPDLCDQSYLFYALSDTETRRTIALMASGAASQANISPRQVESVRILLPPVSTQRKISSVLSAYDDLIENNARRIQILQEMAQRIYREWFVHFRFPGREKVGMVDSELGPIPEGWDTRSVMDVPSFRFVKENVRPYEGKKTYFATADIEGTRIINSGIPYTYSDKPSRAQKQPVSNSVWFARMKDTYKVLVFSPVNSGLAKSCMLSSGFAGFQAEDEWLAYLYFTVNSPHFYQLKDMYCTGATQMSLTNEGLKRIQVTVPTRETAARYRDVVGPIINEILLLQEKNDNLRSTRSLLLPKLISGEVSVEDPEEVSEAEFVK